MLVQAARKGELHDYLNGKIGFCFLEGRRTANCWSKLCKIGEERQKDADREKERHGGIGMQGSGGCLKIP